MTRVLMVVSNGVSHDPRVTAEARSLSNAGYDVTVIGWDRKGNLPETERRDGFTIHRVRNTLGMRLRRYDFFRLGPFQEQARVRASMIHLAKPFDIVHCHDLDTLPVGVAIKEAWNLPLVYDAHEIFHYMLELSRAKRWAPKYEALERDLAPKSDLVIAAGPAHRDHLARLTRAPIVVVTNAKPLAYAEYEPPTTRRMTVIYLGGLEASRMLLPLAELAAEDDSFDVEIGGEGPLGPSLEELAASHTNLRFLGLIPMADVLPKTRAADVVFAMFDPALRLNRIGTPNKFFEALVTGRPILVSKGTWVGDEVEKASCGLAVEYSKEALRSALKRLREDPPIRERLGRNALRLAQERYNWGREEAVLLNAYRAIRSSNRV